MTQTQPQLTPTQQNLVAENEKYASNFKHGALALPPSKHYLVLTCMDARLDPISAFGIPLGSAHVVRNAGGNPLDALRSIVISQQLLGTTEILVIKHTGCGMLLFDTPTATDLLKKNNGEEAVEQLQDALVPSKAGFKDFQTFTDLEGQTRGDVKFLKGSKLIKEGTQISGWIYEVETGRVKQVV